MSDIDKDSLDSSLDPSKVQQYSKQLLEEDRFTASSTHSITPTISEFASVLSDEPRWYDFGIFMNVSTIDLDNIDHNYGGKGNMRCLIEMYKIMETRGLSLSWERIIESLKGIKSFALAEKLRLKYILPCLQSFDSTTPKSPSEQKDLLFQDNSVVERTTQWRI